MIPRPFVGLHVHVTIPGGAGRDWPDEALARLQGQVGVVTRAGGTRSEGQVLVEFDTPVPRWRPRSQPPLVTEQWFRCVDLSVCA